MIDPVKVQLLIVVGMLISLGLGAVIGHVISGYPTERRRRQ